MPDWYNGITAVSKTVNGGSIPSSGANKHMNKQHIRERVNNCSSILADLFKLVDLMDQAGISDSTAKAAILGLIRVYNSRFAELKRSLDLIDENHGPN